MEARWRCRRGGEELTKEEVGVVAHAAQLSPQAINSEGDRAVTRALHVAAQTRLRTHGYIHARIRRPAAHGYHIAAQHMAAHDYS